MNSYPPLKALVFLDSAMRHKSFSDAADELCVTAGAVGQQIHKLEAWLGLPLFTRQIRQVTPTPEGLAYWKRIQPALAQIADASLKLKSQSSRSVSISMPPTFAGQWFTRRMASFLTRHPAVELHINATTTVVDFERDAIDLAVRYFSGNDPNLDATLLFADECRVYCSPAYRDAIGLETPDDLQRATLLDITLQPHWQRWLAQFSQLDPAHLDAIATIHFDQGLLAIEAAKLGQGVVMVSPMLVEEELAQGSLMEPFGLRLPLSTGYYVVHHRKLALKPGAVALKDWLIEVASA